MNLEKLSAAWQRFFFEPISPLPLALFRILYGACVTGTLILLHSHWIDWYGASGWIPQSIIAVIEPQPRLNLFTLMPQTDAVVTAFYWVFLTFAFMLTVGLQTRLSSLMVFLCVVSLRQRNPFILNGGDDVLRIMGFFLVFAPADAALSVDRLIRLRRGSEVGEPPLKIPWAQRMIQLELAFIYLMAFWHKVLGKTWRSGTALYYVLHLHTLTRFPLPPWMMLPMAVRIATWSVLGFQLAFGTLVWFRRFRYPVLLLGLLFHLSIEYTLNIPMFQLDVLSAYALCLDATDIKRFGSFAWRRSHEAGTQVEVEA